MECTDGNTWKISTRLKRLKRGKDCPSQSQRTAPIVIMTVHNVHHDIFCLLGETPPGLEGFLQCLHRLKDFLKESAFKKTVYIYIYINNICVLHISQIMMQH